MEDSFHPKNRNNFFQQREKNELLDELFEQVVEANKGAVELRPPPDILVSVRNDADEEQNADDEQPEENVGAMLDNWFMD